MLDLMPVFQLVMALSALAMAAVFVWNAPRAWASWTWAAFVLAAASSLVLRAGQDQLGPLTWVFLPLAAGTCGTAWLSARAMFRPASPFGWPHMGLVAVIIVLTLAWRLVGSESAMSSMLSNAQTLITSTVIVLTLWEAVANWPAKSEAAERRIRLAFLGTIGLAIGLGVIWLSDGVAAPLINDAAETSALALVLLVSALILKYRLSHPLEGPSGPKSARSRPTPPLDPEIALLARQLDSVVKSRSLYLQENLKVADLARHMGEPEYKVTRAINSGLEEANFSRYINRLRVHHACALMDQDSTRNVLEIALDSGFGSVGPFNRAFKAVTGSTPREYRKRAGANTQAALAS